MANIEGILEQILNTIYGRDMRQSIHDGIRRANEIAETAETEASGAVNEVKEAVAQVETAVEEANEATGRMNLLHKEVTGAEEKRETAEAERQKNTNLAIVAASNANAVADDLTNKRDSGYFTGPQGPKGDKGEKGDTGDRGDSGIVTPVNGLFTLAGDVDGNLYAYYADTQTPPQFEYDITNGSIYYVTPEN